MVEDVPKTADTADDFVFYNGRKLRKGYTTGTTATAASVAATKAILDQADQVTVEVLAANVKSAFVLWLYR